MFLRISSLILAAVSFVAFSQAQTDPDTVLIGGVSFEQLWFDGLTRARSEEGVPLAPQGSLPGLYQDVGELGDFAQYVQFFGDGSAFVPRVTAYWDGTNFSSVWDGLSGGSLPGMIGGATVDSVVGELIGTSRRGVDLVDDMDYQPSILNADVYRSSALQLTIANGFRISFGVNVSGYDLETMRFAAQTVDGSASIQWFYSIDGGGLTPLGTSSSLTSAMAEFSLDLRPLFTGFEAGITIVGQFTGGDGVQVWLDSVQFLGQPPAGGTAPTISGTPPSAATLGAPYAPFTFTVTGVPTPDLEATGLPQGMSVVGLILSGTPTQSGEFPDVKVTASNGTLPNASITFPIIVSAPSSLQNATSGPPPNGVTGAAYGPYTFRVSGYPTPSLAPSSGALPPGLSFSGFTLQGTPTEAGVYSGTLAATNSLGTATLPFSITISGAPAIQPPADLVGRRGEAFSRTFTISGTPIPTVTYSGSLPPGVTFNAAAARFSGTPSSSGYFSGTLTATNSSGNAQLPLTFEIRSTPALELPPGGAVSITEQAVANITFTVNGIPAPTVTVTGLPVWLALTQESDNQSGITSATLSGTPPASSSGIYALSVTATNSDGEQSSTLNLTVISASVSEPPVINVHPVGRAAVAGETVTLTVQASGQPSPGYQWRFNGANLPGATSSTLTLANLQAANAGTYDVVISNSAGSVTSNPAVVSITVPAQITQQPADIITCAGQPVTLGVQATGTAPLAFQWRKDGTAIAGAVSATFSITSASAADAGVYDVDVSNAAGSVSSGLAHVVISGPPQITTQPVGSTVAAGKLIELGVIAESSSSPTYQWRKNGESIASATENVLRIASATAADAASYSVVVTNTCGSVTSTDAVISVVVAPTIKTQPISRFVAAGTTARFTIELNDSTATSYQWLREGAEISGATLANYDLTPVATTDVGVAFTCRVSNIAGAVVSSPARLLVFQPADRVISAPGGEFEVEVFATGDASSSWNVTDNAGWLNARRVTPEGSSPRVRYTATPSAEGEVRSANVTLTAPGFQPGIHAVTQKEVPAVADDFSQPIDPTGQTGTWVPVGGSVPQTYANRFDREFVLGLPEAAQAAGTGVMSASSPAALPAAIGIYSREMLGASTTLRVQGDVFLQVTAEDGGAAEASIGVTDGQSSPPGAGGSAAGLDSGLKLAIRHEAADGSRLGGQTWVSARYRAANGKVMELSRATALPADDLRNRWVRLRLEISAAREASFWIDPEPFGDPLRVWAPADAVREDVLSEQRVVLGLAAEKAANLPYLAVPSALEGIVPRAGSARLLNLSSRVFVGTGDDIAIAGVITQGGTVPLLIRGVGPGLTAFGVPDALEHPRLVMYDNTTPPLILRVQEDWEKSRNAAMVVPAIRDAEEATAAFPLDTGAPDAAWLYPEDTMTFVKVLTPLKTIHFKDSVGVATGVGLLEIFVRPSPGDGEVINLSTRALVPAGGNLIPGFVLGGDSTRLLLIRAVGPSLTTHAIASPLARPAIELYRGQTPLVVNAKWGSSEDPALIANAATASGAFPLGNGSSDSALLLRVPPGLYTAVVHGGDAMETGTALAEIYALPERTSVDAVAAPGF